MTSRKEENPCTFCGKLFRSVGDLKHHLPDYSALKDEQYHRRKYPCGETGCDYRSVRPSDLQKHQRTHTPKKTPKKDEQVTPKNDGQERHDRNLAGIQKKKTVLQTDLYLSDISDWEEQDPGSLSGVLKDPCERQPTLPMPVFAPKRKVGPLQGKDGIGLVPGPSKKPCTTTSSQEPPLTVDKNTQTTECAPTGQPVRYRERKEEWEEDGKKIVEVQKWWWYE